MRLAAGVDDERDGAHNAKSNDQEKVVEKGASRFELCGGNKAQSDGKNRGEDPH